MYVDLNNKTENFIYIVTILQIVRSKSQTSINIIGYPNYILRIMTNIRLKGWDGKKRREKG